MYKEIIEKYIDLWNKKELLGLVDYMTPDVELRSTNVLRFFPDSNGILKGRKELIDYFEIVLQKIPNFEVDIESLSVSDNSIICRSLATDGTLDFHVQYYFDKKNKIYLIKSDLSEKF